MKHYFNTNKVLSVTALAIGAITIFFACKKDDAKSGADDKKDNNTISAAVSEASVNAIYEDVFTTTIEYNARELPANGRKAPVQADTEPNKCFAGVEAVPGDATSFPKTLTINFEGGCTDGHGNTRKGKIIINLEKNLWFSDSKATITFENYSINGIKVEGTVVVTTTSWLSAKKTFTYTVTGGKVTHANGYTATYSGTRKIEYKDNGTVAVSDDVFEITGNATLTDNLGTATATITTPLQRGLLCPWIQAGEVTVTLNAHSGKINYGNGDCDKKAILTVGDKTKEITL